MQQNSSKVVKSLSNVICDNNAKKMSDVSFDSSKMEISKAKPKFFWFLSLSSSKHPSSKQPTPFNFNRHVLLVMYTLYAFLTGCVYFGWPSMSSMLFRSGAFEWLCEPGEKCGNNDENCKCDAQDAKVQNLFCITLTFHSSGSVVAGMLLDFIGPKRTAIIGQSFNFLGWLLLGFSSTKFRAYYFAMIFIGIGADIGFIPVIPLANLFPGNSSLITAILGAAASGSFAIPVIMNTIINVYSLNVSILFFCYCVVGPLFCMFTAMFLFSWKSFLAEDQFEKILVEKIKNKDEACVTHSTSLPSSTKEKFMIETPSHLGNNLPVVKKKDECMFGTQVPNKILKLENDSSVKVAADSNFSEVIALNNEEIPLDETSATNNVTVETENYKEFIVPTTVIENLDQCSNDVQANEANFWKDVFSINFLGVCIIYFIIVNISVSYYLQASNRMFSDSVIYVLDILLPMSFLPCIILGKCVDLFGVMPIIIFMNTSGLLSYVLSLPQVSALHYLSICFFSIYISLYTTQIYCFIMAFHNSKNFGKLSGLSLMVGGLCSLLSFPMYDHLTLQHFKSNTYPVCIGIIVCITAMFLILAYVWIRKNRKVHVAEKFPAAALP